MRFTTTLCAVALMTPVPGLSQMSPVEDPRVVDAGSRVRIAAPVFGGKKQVASVVSVTGDSLVLRQGASTTYLAVAKSDITALEVSRGTYTRKGKGGLWGLLVGAGAGAAIGYVSYKDPKPCGPWCWGGAFSPTSKEMSAAFGGTLGGITGALLGAWIGSHPKDSWAPATVGAK